MGVERIQHREIDDKKDVLKSCSQRIERRGLTADAMTGEEQFQLSFGAQSLLHEVEQLVGIFYIVQGNIFAVQSNWREGV